MVTSEELELVFMKAASNYFHFDKVVAEFAPFRDLKIRWVRTYNTIGFTVSDYLEEAPVGVIEDIADGIFSRIFKEEHEGYPERTSEWLCSHGFRVLNQERYIERSRTVDLDTADAGRLWDSYRRLVSDNLIGEIEDLKLFWSRGESVAKAGQSSCLMKVVIMNRRFLDAKVPEEVLDYCLLHELANVSVPFGSFGIERRREVNEIADGFAGAEKAKRWLDQVMMEV